MDLMVEKRLKEKEEEKEKQRKLLKEVFEAVRRNINDQIASWREVGLSTFPLIPKERFVKMFMRTVKGSFHSVMGPKGLGCIEEQNQG